MKNKPFFLIIVIVLTFVSISSNLMANKQPSVQPLADGKYKYTFWNGPESTVYNSETGHQESHCTGSDDIWCKDVVCGIKGPILPKGTKIDLWKNLNESGSIGKGYINCTIEKDFNTVTGEELIYSIDDSKPVFTNYNEWLNATK